MFDQFALERPFTLFIKACISKIYNLTLIDGAKVSRETLIAWLISFTCPGHMMHAMKYFFPCLLGEWVVSQSGIVKGRYGEMKNSFPCNKNHGQKTFRVKSSRRHSTGKNETQEEGTYRCRKRLKELDKREREGKGDTSLGNFHLRAKKKRKGVNSTGDEYICYLYPFSERGKSWELWVGQTG